ncbi:methionyl-tRNA formyltransferase [Rhodocytophaga rosea]|uniref:Methionyl-tRNA formyltransferase n=1 Tax=Rhodocytophaga rosea TaxID=2704465 RepID=A0A6C0GLK9_9BACT|nr:formyltransferase family protein [Rhodocytophaga rosea]QHT68827.1 methionyl-tRNA formyltransferase [Rhodocytophaga rosea]
MARVILANSNPVHRVVEKNIIEIFYDIKIINSKEELTPEFIDLINPDFIFFIHWSYIIPEVIYKNYTCVVFHMTDLPFGRGGSPLQNLIVRGFTETVITAIRVEAGIDTGDIYLKKPLSLLGTAEEIFLRAGQIMLEMIKQIIAQPIVPVPQQGESVVFKRRKQEDSNISEIEKLSKVYDYIRMLDAENYPKAFLESKYLKFEFSRATLKSDCIIADVTITKR